MNLQPNTSKSKESAPRSAAVPPLEPAASARRRPSPPKKPQLDQQQQKEEKPWPPPLDRDVKAVLDSLRLDQRDYDAYASAFAQQRINTAAALVSLTPEQLYDCGVHRGHVHAFVQAIGRLKDLLEVAERRRRATLQDPAQPRAKPAVSQLDRARATEFIRKLPQVVKVLSRDLIDLHEQCGLMVLAVLCREHCLLLGPPGVAKSTLCERLFALFDVPPDERENAFFHRLLTRFTLPDELFGPVSLQLLKEDKYQRNTQRYLPQARVAFLDEIFKSNSAILNALLTILNERLFDNGVTRSKVPLMVMVAASNEYPPDSGELQALYDRFLFRSWIDPNYSRQSFGQLLDLPYESGPVELEQRLKLTEGMIEHIHRESAQVRLPPAVVNLLFGMSEALARKGRKFYTSPRRWKKIGFVLRVAAYCHGRTAVCLSDCALLRHFVWQKHNQRDVVWKLYAELVAAELARLPSRAELTPVRDNIKRHVWLSREEKQDLGVVCDTAELVLPTPPQPQPQPKQMSQAPEKVHQMMEVDGGATMTLTKDEAFAKAVEWLANNELYLGMREELKRGMLAHLEHELKESVWDDAWPDEATVRVFTQEVMAKFLFSSIRLDQ